MTPLQYQEKWSLYESTCNSACRDLRCVGFSPDGKYIAFGGGEALSVGIAESGELKIVVKKSGISATSLQWSCRGQLVCAFADGTIINVMLNEQTLGIQGLVAASHSIDCLSISRGGDDLASGAGSDIRIWHRRGQDNWIPTHRLGMPRMFQDNVNADVEITGLHWRNGDATSLLVSYRHHGIQIWDVQSESVVSNVLNTSSSLGRSALSPDYQHLCIVMQGGVDIYDIERNIPATPLRTRGGVSSPVLFIHNGEAVLASCEIGYVRLWERISGERLQTLHHSDDGIIALAEFHRGERRLFRIATVSKDKLTVWQTITGEHLASPGGLKCVKWIFVLIVTVFGVLLSSSAVQEISIAAFRFVVETLYL